MFEFGLPLHRSISMTHTYLNGIPNIEVLKMEGYHPSWAYTLPDAESFAMANQHKLQTGNYGFDGHGYASHRANYVNKSPVFRHDYYELDSKYWPWRLPREYTRPSNPHHWMIDRCDAYVKPSVSRYYRPYRPMALTSYYYG
ncbi:hypothetical protein AAVH_10269 [Aphelenchoides avenae]|nr:hypothetical protein AAVH_10269 [Aphelenchus avenae]